MLFYDLPANSQHFPLIISLDSLVAVCFAQWWFSGAQHMKQGIFPRLGVNRCVPQLGVPAQRPNQLVIDSGATMKLQTPVLLLRGCSWRKYPGRSDLKRNLVFDWPNNRSTVRKRTGQIAVIQPRRVSYVKGIIWWYRRRRALRLDRVLLRLRCSVLTC